MTYQCSLAKIYEESYKRAVQTCQESVFRESSPTFCHLQPQTTCWGHEEEKKVQELRLIAHDEDERAPRGYICAKRGVKFLWKMENIDTCVYYLLPGPGPREKRAQSFRGTSDEGKVEQNKIRRFISFFVSIEGGWRNGWRTYRENIYIIFLLAQSLLAAWIATGASFSCGTIWFSRQRRRKWENVDDGNDVRQLLSSNVANFFCQLPILWPCLYGSSVLQRERKKIVYWFDLWCSTLFFTYDLNLVQLNFVDCELA